IARVYVFRGNIPNGQFKRRSHGGSNARMPRKQFRETYHGDKKTRRNGKRMKAGVAGRRNAQLKGPTFKTRHDGGRSETRIRWNIVSTLAALRVAFVKIAPPVMQLA